MPLEADIDLRWWLGLLSNRRRTESSGWRAAGPGHVQSASEAQGVAGQTARRLLTAQRGNG